jgi:hypothetical protein
MLAEYRRREAGDATLLQPLANACRRAAAFEWQLFTEADTVRRLWGESARALAQGFTRRRAGFDPSPDQFTLALHLAIAAREGDAFTSLALAAPNLRAGVLREARAFHDSRAHFHLAEGYALVARALVERESETALQAVEILDAAREESDFGWWSRHFPNALEAAWRMSEHETVCVLLGAVARRIIENLPEAGDVQTEQSEELAERFARVTDETLLRLDKFVERDRNHHPKLYVWLPGLALCALAASAGLPMHWLEERHASHFNGYERLPSALLRSTTQN